MSSDRAFTAYRDCLRATTLCSSSRSTPTSQAGQASGRCLSNSRCPSPNSFSTARTARRTPRNIFTPVTVSAGAATTWTVDFILNGFSNAAPVLTNEVEPNQKKKKPQKLSGLPVDIRGAAASGDASVLKIDFGGGITDKVEDLYRFTVTTHRVLCLRPGGDKRIGRPRSLDIQ